MTFAVGIVECGEAGGQLVAATEQLRWIDAVHRLVSHHGPGSMPLRQEDVVRCWHSSLAADNPVDLLIGEAAGERAALTVTCHGAATRTARSMARARMPSHQQQHPRFLHPAPGRT